MLPNNPAERNGGYFGEDSRRISHACKVTEYAEELLKEEGEGDYLIVVGAAVLHVRSVQYVADAHRVLTL